MAKHSWHRIEHKSTGEVQIVASLNGIDRKHWKAVPVKGNKRPGEFHVVGEDGSLVLDQALKERARLDALPLAERIAIEVESALKRRNAED
jgi:hypothetical protein